jgi:A/G-specific adenine glycosylase
MLRYGRENPRAFPWRSTRDPYEVLIAEVLLQRTRGGNVASVHQALVDAYPSAERLAQASVADIERHIYPLGLAKRAKLIHELAASIVSSGGVPRDATALRRLPGVGPYTANAVRVFALGKNEPLVDWVIARVLRRYFAMPSAHRPNADAELWLVAREVVHAGRARDIWLAVIDLSAEYCRRIPQCERCPMRRCCQSADLASSAIT